LAVRRPPRSPITPAGRRRTFRAAVVEAMRGPYGQRGGALAGWHPVDLSAEIMNRVLAASGLGAVPLEDVILGCTSQVGAQAANVARRAVLAAGWPEGVPAMTVESDACSSLRSVNLAAQSVASGRQFVLAGGVEVTSAVPRGAPLAQPATGKPYGARLTARYKNQGGLAPPGLVAEEVARRWSLSRQQLDAWAGTSLERARAAQAAPPRYIAAVQRLSPSSAADPEQTPPVRGRKVKLPGLLERDEALDGKGRRPGPSRLLPLYLQGGVITAGNMAGEGDGAAAVLVASPTGMETFGLVAKALITGFAASAASPAIWPVSAVPATLSALQDAGLRKADIDRWYVHESSAAAVLAWSAETGVALDDVNPNGGALASTAPVGAVGAGLVAEAVAGLATGRNGTAVVCVAGEGGLGTACVLTMPT
jgi:acetyl-CoA acyltransferase